jgi:adenine-specific DNA-methyltransferase
VIKYLGSKRVLLPRLLELVGVPSGSCTVLDLFSGTSRVGHALKRAGWRVVANDHNAYAHALGTCYVQADASRWLREATMLVAEFNALPGRPGYFTSTFCEEARFFMPRNGARVDAVREAIARKGLPRELEAIMLVSLMEAADRVDSTTGLQMAYLKQWAPRARNDLSLRVPELVDRPTAGACEAHGLDAAVAAAMPADVAYVDPPYNQHSYLGNYHVWETLVRWDAPAAYGVARKREDCRTRKSPFNARRTFESAMRTTLASLRAPKVVISFSDEGFISREAMEALIADALGAATRVTVCGVAHRRYVGAQIGIHNPAGEKVGVVSHLVNREFFFVADRSAASLTGGGDRREVQDPQEGTRRDRARARPGR